MLGETATKLGQADEAVGAYERAYDIDNDDSPTLKGLAASYFRAERWDDAFKYHQLLLVQHRDALGRDEHTRERDHHQSLHPRTTRHAEHKVTPAARECAPYFQAAAARVAHMDQAC